MAAYEIRLAGCDAVTSFVMELSAKEANLLKLVAAKSAETSTLNCEPRMTIAPAPADTNEVPA